MATSVFAGSYARATDLRAVDYVEVFPAQGKTSLLTREVLWRHVEEILRTTARKRRERRRAHPGRRKKGYGTGTLGDDPLGAVRDVYRKLQRAHARRDPSHAGCRRAPTLIETCVSAGISLSTLKRVCQGAWPPL